MDFDFSHDPSPFVGMNAAPQQLGAVVYAPTPSQIGISGLVGHITSRSTLYIAGAAVAALLAYGYWTHTINK